MSAISLYLHQVVHGERNRLSAEGKGRIYIKILGGRGEIRSADSVVLAGSQASFHLFSREPMSKEQMSNRLKAAGLVAGWARMQKQDRPVYLPYLIASNIPVSQAVWIFAHPENFPEFALEVFPSRVYRASESWGNVLGYIGEISQQELEEKQDEGYIPGDWIGKLGLERQYEARLRGTPGYVLIDSFAGGAWKQVKKKVNPVAGESLALTLNSSLQEIAYQYLKNIGKPGTVLIADAQSGAIRAFASYPSFEPGIFTSSGTENERNRVLRDPMRPMIHRASSGLYSPGSVFKLVVAIAALASGKFHPSSSFTCTGSMLIGKREFRCWKSGGHGTISFHQAISQSCDVAFYKMGMALGPETLAKWANILGFGQSTGLDFPFEKKGVIPTEGWKKKTLGEKWFAGDTANLSIGQGFILTTPAQILQFLLILNGGGFSPKLHLTEQTSDKDGKQRLVVPEMVWDAVLTGMEKAVTEGTATRCLSPYFKVWGKTGTAEVAGKAPHSWFAALAQIGEEMFAGVALVEGGGKGSATALPLLCSVFQYIAHQQNLAPPPKIGILLPPMEMESD